MLLLAVKSGTNLLNSASEVHYYINASCMSLVSFLHVCTQHYRKKPSMPEFASYSKHFKTLLNFFNFHIAFYKAACYNSFKLQ